MTSVQAGQEIPRLTGAELEKLVNIRLEKYRTAGVADIRRSGVQAVMLPNGQWQVTPSRPDYEGVLRGGTHVCFDAKVCSQSTFNLAKYRWEEKGVRRLQLRYMLDKSQYGVQCFFLIHWNRRDLKSKSEPEVTYAFPVHFESDFWQRFAGAEVRSISRMDCEEFGVVVPWNLFGDRDRTMQPDIRAIF